MSQGQLVEVAFKGNRREFFLWPFETLPKLKTPVIVDADRGEDLGLVHATGELAERRKAGTTHGKAAPDHLRGVLRAATRDEIARGAQLRIDEDNVRKRAIEKVRSQGLEMKVSDSEWQWDKKKLTIYFTAEKRVDFRELVRQLEGLFGTRVQMWHIGVRDEARRLDGVGRCARQFCSASWLPELRPVKSSTAKDQRLSTLNPAQISGSCGRLMCCLRYEHEFYVQQRRRFPKEGKVLVTALGEEKVISNDIFREQVTLRTLTGDTRVLMLAALQRELGAETLSTTAEHRVEIEAEDDVEGEEQTEPRVLITIERAQPHVEPTPVPDAVPPPEAARPEGARPEGARPEEARTEPARSEGAPLEAAPQDRGGRRRRRGRRGGRRGRGGGEGSPAAS
jgi:cell fate regulator YaaT (PSP1 superfamily)